jgi:hypothetical protein
MRGQAVRDGVALGMQRRQVVERARDVPVPLHRLEGTEHRQRVDQPLARCVQADVPRHAARELRQLQRHEFVEVDGFEQAVVERTQHFGRNERDAEGALARLQMIDRAGHGRCCGIHVQCRLRKQAASSRPTPWSARPRRSARRAAGGPCVS